MGKSFRQNRLLEKEAAIKAFNFSALLCFFVILAAGCVQQPLPEADSLPGLLYSGKCSLCHAPFHPQAHTYTGWKKVVKRMEQNAEAQGMNNFLSEEERASILAYLEKNARKGF